MSQRTAIKEPATFQIENTNKTAEVFDRSPSSAGWSTNNPKPARRSILQGHAVPETVEAFVEANAAAAFMHYSARSIKQMAREGRIPAHPFGTGSRKKWYFLISELAEHLRSQVNSAHGEAGRD